MILASRTQLTAIAWVLVVGASLSTGCKLANYKPTSRWPMDVATEPQTPTKIAAIWSDTVLYTAGKAPTRGFGGRIYFYDERTDAIKVDGQLIVYIYDDDDPAAGNQPVRRFVFSSEQLARHYSGSELGPSYSVWIPWDEVGGPTKQLSLVPFFIPAEGGLVAGSHARHRLPGVENPAASAVTPAAHAQYPSTRSVPHGQPVRQVAHTAQPTSMQPASNAMRTTTINVPGATRDRLANSHSIPRSQRSYVASQTRNDNQSGWDHYDRAKFSAARADQYRDERFSRQRAAPWEQREPAHQPVQLAAAEESPQTATPPKESAEQWAERYLQRQLLQQQGSLSSPPRVGLGTEVRYGPSTHPAPTGPTARPSFDREPSPPVRAGWQSGLPSQW